MNQENEKAFIQDCIAFCKKETSVNPFVSNNTCYGIPYSRAMQLLQENEIKYPECTIG